MSIKYTSKEKKNSLRAESTNNRYAIIQSTGDVTRKSSGKEISCRCTVTTADTLAVFGGTDASSVGTFSGRSYRMFRRFRFFPHRHRRRKYDKRRVVLPGIDLNK